MITTSSTSSEDALEQLWDALRAAQQLQEDRLSFGLDHVNLYVEDVEGDWLERWGEDEQINLGKWFENNFEVGWQPVEELFCTEEGNFDVVFRTAGVKRAKLIDLGMRWDGQDVALIVTIKQEGDQKVGILVQLHPVGNEIYLPEGLKLFLLGLDGKVLYEVGAKSTDNVIQLELDSHPGEQFRVQVALGDVTVNEYFAL